MLALRSSPPAVSPGEGERIARELYGLAVTASAMPGERDCNLLLRDGGDAHYVLKILDSSEPQAPSCLVRVLARVQEQDATLPVPRVIPTLSGDDLGTWAHAGAQYRICLVSYLTGKLLAHTPRSAHLLAMVGAALARLDYALQGFFHVQLGQSLAWDVRRLPELLEFAPLLRSSASRAAVERVAGAVRAALPAWRRLPAQAIHGDCHAHNLLIDDATGTLAGILDFGDMIHAPRVFEPAIAMSELLTEGLADTDMAGAILQGYQAQEPLHGAELDAVFDIVVARHAITVLLHAWRCQHDPHGAALIGESAARAADSLAQLEVARGAITHAWRAGADSGADPTPSLARRNRLMGAGAELFYQRPLHIVRGKGVWMYAADGRAYLDVYNNVAHVGHSHPKVAGAIARQSALFSGNTRYLHHLILDYAARLTATLPPRLNACIFVNSGSEANDVAWRMAKMVTGRQGALIMSHAYHGITDAVGALTPGAGVPQDSWVATIPIPQQAHGADDAFTEAQCTAAKADVERAVAQLAARGVAPAAWFLDSALTSSGIVDAPSAWGEAVARQVRATGALVIGDEVQYGLGRSGSDFWGFARRGLLPDIVTLGKPIGNGFPMGAIIADRELIEAFQAKSGFFSTFGGSPVAAAAGLAVLEVLEQECLQANAQATGEYLQQRLQALAARHALFGAVRGHGLLWGMEVRGADVAGAKRNTRAVLNALAEYHGVLIGSEGPLGNVLKMRPPMPFTTEHADLLCNALDAVAPSCALI